MLNYTQILKIKKTVAAQTETSIHDVIVWPATLNKDKVSIQLGSGKKTPKLRFC